MGDPHFKDGLHSSYAGLPGSATAGSHRGNEEATFTCGLVSAC